MVMEWLQPVSRKRAEAQKTNLNNLEVICKEKWTKIPPMCRNSKKHLTSVLLIRVLPQKYYVFQARGIKYLFTSMKPK